jgi:hypothetical protein
MSSSFDLLTGPEKAFTAALSDGRSNSLIEATNARKDT